MQKPQGGIKGGYVNYYLINPSGNFISLSPLSKGSINNLKNKVEN